MADASALALDALPPHDHARLQLITLFDTGFGVGEWLELRCLDCSVTPARVGPREYVRSVTAFVDVAMKYRDHWDAFFGVRSRRCPTMLGTRDVGPDVPDPLLTTLRARNTH